MVSNSCGQDLHVGSDPVGSLLKPAALCSMTSLVPSPPPVLLSLAVRMTLTRPGKNDHMMYATVYVTHAIAIQFCSLVPV